jgi:hypothetical protein
VPRGTESPSATIDHADDADVLVDEDAVDVTDLPEHAVSAQLNATRPATAPSRRATIERVYALRGTPPPLKPGGSSKMRGSRSGNQSVG